MSPLFFSQKMEQKDAEEEDAFDDGKSNEQFGETVLRQLLGSLIHPSECPRCFGTHARQGINRIEECLSILYAFHQRSYRKLVRLCARSRSSSESRRKNVLLGV